MWHDAVSSIGSVGSLVNVCYGLSLQRIIVKATRQTDPPSFGPRGGTLARIISCSLGNLIYPSEFPDKWMLMAGIN